VRRLFGYFSFSMLFVTALRAALLTPDCGQCIAQNIFDEDAGAEREEAEKPAITEDDGESAPKVATVKKKKKKSRKKKKQGPQTEPAASAGQEFSPQELARQSYAWAPEPGFRLKSTAPGIHTAQSPAPIKAAAVAPAEVLQTPVQAQGFKLPQIPLSQVLIVAGFAILFLIYRFRVSRQMRHKKY
jgi:hypothetical protein